MSHAIFVCKARLEKPNYARKVAIKMTMSGMDLSLQLCRPLNLARMQMHARTYVQMCLAI